MRIPESPPDLEELLQRLARSGRLFEPELLSIDDSRYFHWDDLRYREPPGALTREEWWAALALQRRTNRRTLPLRDVGHRAFSLTTPDAVLRGLHLLDQRLAGSLGLPDGVDPRTGTDRYVIASTMEEAIASSQLEGASTTRRVAKVMLQTGRAPRNLDERMIWNNYQALQWVREHRDQPLDVASILELHRIATEGTLDDPQDAGRLRRSDDIVIRHAPSDTTLHVPPPAAELQHRMEALVRFANASGDEGPFIHPGLRAIVLHFQLAYDHPFVDGNGRTARALFTWSLLHRGYWLAEYLALSRILKRAPTKYAMAFLQVETDHQDLTYFALHQLRALRMAADELDGWLQRRATRTARARRHLRDGPDLNPRQAAVVDHALRHPDAAYEIAIHQAYHHVSYPTARADLLGLAERGLLDRSRQGRKLVFYVPADLERRLADPS